MIIPIAYWLSSVYQDIESNALYMYFSIFKSALGITSTFYKEEREVK